MILKTKIWHTALNVSYVQALSKMHLNNKPFHPFITKTFRQQTYGTTLTFYVG